MTRRRVCWSLLALLLLPCLLSSAPAPKADKKAKPLTMLGDFTETWNGQWNYEAWFRDDGTCGAVGEGDRWRGSWSLRGRTLYVREECGDRWVSWEAVLGEDLAGRAVVRGCSQEACVGQRVAVRFTKR